MNKLAYLILNVLKDMDASNKMSSMSASEVHHEIRESKYSYSAVYKTLKNLKTIGHVAMGIKDGGSNTFYITDTGIKAAESIKD